MVRSVWPVAGALALVLLHAPSTHGASNAFRGIPSLLEMEAVDGDVYARDALLATYGEPPPEGCAFTEWASAGGCDALTLVETFTRSVTRGDTETCGPLSEQRKCAPVHCEMTKWTAWSACNEMGEKIRTREVTTFPANGGRSCPHAVDKVKCRKQDCQVCEFGPWVCDPHTGQKTHTRHVTKQRELDGMACPALIETEDCDPVNCEVYTDQFEKWSSCSAHGKKTRAYKIKVAKQYKGNACPADQEEDCTNCVYNTEQEELDAGGTFGKCISDEEPLPTWFKHMTLTFKAAAANGGDECDPEKAHHKKKCEPVKCKRYTADEDTGDYSMCAKKGDGKWYKQRALGVKEIALYGGSCDEEVDEKVCEPVKCKRNTALEDTGDYSECEKKNDDKWYKQRALGIKESPLYGGSCDEEIDEKVCEPINCKRNSPLEEQSDFDACKETEHGKWFKHRLLGVKELPKYGGTCNDEFDEKPCELIHCVYNTEAEQTAKGGKFGECTPSDVAGTKWHRHMQLDINIHDANGGNKCVAEEADLRQLCTAVDCVRKTANEDKTTEFPACATKSDGKWYKKRVLGIKTEAQYGGACPETFDEQPCPAVDCVRKTIAEDSTTKYGSCAKKNDDKWFKERCLGIKTEAQYDGACPEKIDEQLCPAVDCMRKTAAEDTTTEYGACEQKGDGKWYKKRYLPIKTSAQYGGTCPPKIDEKVCEPENCIEDLCHNWSGCRNREKTRVCPAPKYGGQACATTKACGGPN